MSSISKTAMRQPTVHRPTRIRSRLAGRALAARVAGGLLVLVLVAPFLYALSTALRSPADVARDAVAFPAHLDFSNFSRVFSQIQYARSVFNSLVITVGTCALVVLFGSMAGYALGRVSEGVDVAAWR